jgi:predicted nuclease of predicted toxin-antitoxin system
MKIKLDENLTARLSAVLSSLGHEVHTVFDEGLEGKSDDQVWRVTQAEHRFLITQDSAFADVRSYPPGTHFGILHLRLGTKDRLAQISRVAELFASEDPSSRARCLVVATETKVRVVRP